MSPKSRWPGFVVVEVATAGPFSTLLSMPARSSTVAARRNSCSSRTDPHGVAVRQGRLLDLGVGGQQISSRDRVDQARGDPCRVHVLGESPQSGSASGRSKGGGPDATVVDRVTRCWAQWSDDSSVGVMSLLRPCGLGEHRKRGLQVRPDARRVDPRTLAERNEQLAGGAGSSTTAKTSAAAPSSRGLVVACGEHHLGRPGPPVAEPWGAVPAVLTHGGHGG